MLRPDDIAGYSYAADIACPSCVVSLLPAGDGEPFDGWALGEGVRMSTEDNLSEIAAAFGIDRMDERSSDSGDFPKVIFASDADEGQTCGTCGEAL